MIAWRLCRAPFLALDGEGARRYGGRWNAPGAAVVYASAHLSLAVLELLVHTDADLLPETLYSLAIDIPDRVKIFRPALPKNWRTPPQAEHLRAIGASWLQTAQGAVMAVPSAVLPQEENILINPLHPDAKRIKLAAKQRFHLDKRLL